MVTVPPTPTGSRGRRALWVGLIVLVVAAVTAVVVVLVTSSEDGKAMPAKSRPGGGQQQPTRGLTAPPSPMHWEPYHGFPVPVSQVHGPSQINGAMASGYSHTPAGALIAYVQITYRAALAPGDSWRPVVDQQIIGPASDKVMRKMSQLDRTRPIPRLQAVAGFRFRSYTDQVAVIEIATGDWGSYTIGTTVLHWKNGDWRIYLAAGSTASARSISQFPEGFVVWKAG